MSAMVHSSSQPSINRPSMRTCRVWLVVAIFCGLGLLGSVVQPNQTFAGELLPRSLTEKLGLTEAWSRVVASPTGSSSIIDVQIYVHAKNLKEYVEVFTPLANEATPAVSPLLTTSDGPVALTPAPTAKESGRVESRIWVNHADRLGQLVGIDEAKRRANNQVRRLKRRGIEATVRVTTAPWVAMYSIANDGTVQSRDAETGTPLWTIRVGDPSLPYGKLGVNDEHVTVINGTQLILIDVVNGQIIQELTVSRPTLFGAINSGVHAMLMGISGTVESYSLFDLERDPTFESFSGRALAAPVKAPGSTRLAWGSDAGFVYAMELDGTPTILFRLKTDGVVAGRVASASGDRFFFGTDRGQVYGIHATNRGQVLWTFPFGDSFVEQPLVADDQLLIRSASGNLHSLALLNGEPTWSGPVSAVADLYGLLGEYIFVKTSRGSLAVLDRDSGTPLGVYRSVQPHRVVRNTLTDRFYLMDSDGTVQCLRPTKSELPTLLAEFDEAGAASEETQPAESADEPPAESNPFDAGGSSNPFDSGSSDPFGSDGGGDPFGGDGGDPFGGSDPFGGDDDPFGN